MSDLRLIRLTQSSDECWTHLPILRREIQRAADPDHLCQPQIGIVIDRIVANFYAEGTDAYLKLPPGQRAQMDPLTTAVWYIWDDAAGALRGHLLALQGEWDGEQVVYVYQMWAPRRPFGLRRDRDLEALQDGALAELDAYARARGADRVLMYTKRPARYWSQRFGFTMVRFMYEREVGP